MGERFTGQRCQDCQGGLIYNKQEKYWECPYCGKIYERELRFNKVQIDGLAGINDLGRATLSEVLALDFESAEKNLAECEKLNHSSIATHVAKLSFLLFKSFYSKDRQAELNKLNAFLIQFNREFVSIEEEEEILYDFINSADIYALLYVVYSMTGQKDRKQMVLDMLDTEYVVNPNISKYLINAFLKEGNVEQADVLLKNTTKENSKNGIMSVLSLYPSTETKVVHIENLLNKLPQETDMSKIFDNYFETTKDDEKVIVDLFLSVVSYNVSFNTQKVIENVLKYCTDEETAKKTFEAMSKKRFDDNTANAILHWTMDKCLNSNVSKIAFESLFASNSVFEIADDEIIEVLSSEQDEELKYEKLKQMLATFKMSSKNLDKVFAYHLLQNRGEPEYRKNIYYELLSRLASIPFSVFEEYVLKIDFDRGNKAEFIQAGFEKIRMGTILAGILSQYMKSSVDSPEVREKVITVFLNNGFTPDLEATSWYLLNFAETHAENILNALDRLNCKVASGSFNEYIGSLADCSKVNQKIIELLTKNSFVITARSFQKYLLHVVEPEGKKIARVAKCLSSCNGDLRETRFTVDIAETQILCNLTQAFFLLSKDDLFVTKQIVIQLEQAKIKLDNPIELPKIRKKAKFKNFIRENEQSLGAKIKALEELL